MGRAVDYCEPTGVDGTKERRFSNIRRENDRVVAARTTKNRKRTTRTRARKHDHTVPNDCERDRRGTGFGRLFFYVSHGGTAFLGPSAVADAAAAAADDVRAHRKGPTLPLHTTSSFSRR